MGTSWEEDRAAHQIVFEDVEKGCFDTEKQGVIFHTTFFILLFSQTHQETIVYLKTVLVECSHSRSVILQ